MSLPADQKLRGRLRSHIQFSQLRRPNFLRKKSCLILTPLGFAFHAPNDFPHCFAIQIELPGDRWQRETVDSSRIDFGVALRLAVEVHVEYHNFVMCSAYAIVHTSCVDGANTGAEFRLQRRQEPLQMGPGQGTNVTHCPQIRSKSLSDADNAMSNNESISSTGTPASRKALLTSQRMEKSLPGPDSFTRISGCFVIKGYLPSTEIMLASIGLSVQF